MGRFDNLKFSLSGSNNLKRRKCRKPNLTTGRYNEIAIQYERSRFDRLHIRYRRTRRSRMVNNRRFALTIWG